MSKNLVRLVSNLAELTPIIRSPKLTVVDFFATWCGPCKMIAPSMEKLAEDTPYVNFVKVDVDVAQDITRQFRIAAMPTFIYFRDGNVVEQFQGADFAQLERLVQKYAVKPQPKVIPNEDILKKMGGKDLLALMAEHSIPSLGLAEKQDLIEELLKKRDEIRRSQKY